MDLDWSEEQTALRDMVRGVCAQYAPLEVVRQMEDDPTGFPAELWKQLGELGVTGILIPEAYGGAGADAARSGDRLRGARPRAGAVAALPERGGRRRRAARRGQRGAEEGVAAAASRPARRSSRPRGSSPASGFGPEGVQLRARRDGADYVLSGDEAPRALRERRDAPPRAGAHRRRARGRGPLPRRPARAGRDAHASSGASPPTRSTRSSSADVRVAARSERVGAAGSGWPTFDAVMHDGIILLAAWAMGGAERALEITVQYAKDRKQFDKPLGAFQAISHYLADARDRASTAARRSSTRRPGRAPSGRSIARLAPMAKLFACQTYRDVTAMCQQVWGGVGFTHRVRHPALLPPRQAAPDHLVGHAGTWRSSWRARCSTEARCASGAHDGEAAPPLAGLRVIESSLLGPGAITTAPRRPRRRGHQGRVALRRLHPRDDLADRRGRLADAPPRQPRQAEPRARPAQARGGRGLPRPRARRRRRRRGDAPGLAREAAASATTQLRKAEPAHRLLQHLGLRHDRAVQGPPRARHRLRHLGRHRHAAPSTTRASCYIPEHASIGIHAGPLFGALGDPRRGDPRARDRRGLRARDRPVRRRRVHGLVPDRELEGVRAARSPRSPATSPTTTSAARPAPPACARASATRSTSRSDGHVLFMASRAGVLEELLRGRRPHGAVRALARLASTPTTRAATASCSASCATIFKTKTAAEWIALRRRAEHPDRAGEHAEDDRATTRSSRTASRGIRANEHGADMLPFPVQVRRREAAGADARRRPWASTPTRCCATCSATTRSGSRSCGRAARSARGAVARRRRTPRQGSGRWRRLAPLLRSETRILTTHAGSLPRPRALDGVAGAPAADSRWTRRARERGRGGHARTRWRGSSPPASTSATTASSRARASSPTCSTG